jgi:DNA-binding response OmpR family regulator
MDKKKILLVEDDAILAKTMYDELVEAGYEVDQAYDGEAGLRMVGEKKPDLVLLDILMPKKNGFEVLQSMKAAPETKDIPVIMLTALAADEDVETTMLGASDYLVKSEYTPTQIVEKVKNFFIKQI